jgi:1-acyl-sn-glycerol-3-phosphate acyltransferase
MKGHNPSLFYRFIMGFAKLFFKLFFRVKIEGLQNFEKGAALIASNHVSYLDPPLIAISCPEETHFIAKDSLLRSAFFKKIFVALNTHAVKGGVKDVHTFKKIHQLLEEGKKVILFPEGTRGRSSEIGNLKRGIASIFCKSHATIIPVYLHGTYEAWGRRHKFPRIGKTLIVRFGPGIHWEEFAHINPAHIEEIFLERLSLELHKLKQKCESI